MFTRLFRWALVFTLAFACASCAALGLGMPRSRAIPLGTKLDPDYGRCVSSGYEVDLPPHATVAFVASTCVRPFDAGTSAPPEPVHDASADAITNATGIEPESIPGLRVDGGSP